MLLFGLLATSNARAQAPADSARTLLRHAKTYFLLGMEEQGNMAAYRRSEAYLNRARKVAQRASLPDSTTRLLSRKMQALRQDLSAQQELAHDTFYGVFPLARLLAPSLFSDPTTTGTYELVEAPAVRASADAARTLRRAVLEEWAMLPQLDVVFRSTPRHPELENKVYYTLDGSSRLFARSSDEIADVLSAAELRAFRAGRVDSALSTQLREALGVPRLLVVNVRKMDQVEGNHFYQTEGRLYESGQAMPDQVMTEMGFGRDRRAQFGSILLGHALLLLLALGVYAALALGGRFKEIHPGVLVVPLVAFVLGRILPWGLVPLLNTVAPPPDTLVTLSFWWPLSVGLALFALPNLLFWFGAARLGLHPRGRGGAASVAVTLGVCAYLLTPLLLLLESGGWPLLAITVAAAGAGAYLLGLVMDSLGTPSIAFGLLPAAFALLLGAALLHAEWGSLLAVAVPVVALNGGVVWWYERTPRGVSAAVQPATQSTESPRNAPTTLQGLIERAERGPSYQPFETYWRAKEKLEPLHGKKTTWMGLKGKSGTGKTATAWALIEELRREADQDQDLVLHGRCPEPLPGSGESPAYEPFQQALKRHFELHSFVSPEAQMQQVNAALDGLFDTFVPFVSLLLPPAEEAQNAARSREEMFHAVTDVLRELTRRRPTILFIDDVQWIDESSQALFRHILDTFPDGGNTPLTVLATSRSSGKLAELGLSVPDCKQEMMPLSEEQRAEILVALGLTPDAARAVVVRLGPDLDERGALFWMLQVVEHLARQGVLHRSEQGFALSDSVDPSQLPMPDELRQVLEERLDQFPAYRSVLGCAACLGDTFSATVLAKCLGVARLEALQLLDGVENDTGVLHDVREQDDQYAFHSSYLLEGVRSHFAISGAGPAEDSVPQLIREYHARAAQALEEIHEEEREIPHEEIANHYYAAGQSRAEEALSACRRAARAACAQFSYDHARRFVDKAQECADVLGRDIDLKGEHVRIDALEAHVTGEHRLEAAEEGLRYLTDRSEPALAVVDAVAQVCYDAGRDGNRRFFEEAVRLGHLLIERGSTLQERAEGHHFVGVALSTAEAERRTEHLRKALALVEKRPETDRAAQRLHARLLNSLGEQLSYGSGEQREEAARLFERRLDLNERLHLGDLPGLARTHGGLGRLAYYRENPDLQTARRHFERDLELSEQIGDVAGQAMMHSLLGGCAREEGRPDDALHHYERSFEQSAGAKDQFFALAGLLEIHAERHDEAAVREWGHRLAEQINAHSIPSDPAKALSQALEACEPLAADDDWFGAATRHVCAAMPDDAVA